MLSVTACGVFTVIMKKSKALKILIDLKKQLDELPKRKGLPVGKGFMATRSSLKNKITWLSMHKTDEQVHRLFTDQARKDIDEYMECL